MSITCLNWVLQESKARLGPRLVLIALADNAHEDGSRAFPAVETIARKAGLSRNGVQKALRRLEADGMIRPVGITPKRTVIYQIVMEGIKSVPTSEGHKAEPAEGINSDVGGHTASAQTVREPTTEPSESAHAQTTLEDGTVAGKVHELLIAIAVKRSCKAPGPSAVLKVLEAYPDRDAVRVANELDFWAVDGAGSDRPIKNLASTYRNFMRQSEPAPAATDNGIKSSTPRSAYDQIANA